MKTNLFFAIAILFAIVSCNSTNKVPLTTFEPGQNYKKIDLATAKLHIRTLKKIKERKKWVYRNYVDHHFLADLFTEKDGTPIDSVKFMFGGIREKDENNKYRMMITTIVQIKRKATTAYTKPPYDYYLLKSGCCPPPYNVPCPMEVSL